MEATAKARSADCWLEGEFSGSSSSLPSSGTPSSPGPSRRSVPLSSDISRGLKRDDVLERVLWPLRTAGLSETRSLSVLTLTSPRRLSHSKHVCPHDRTMGFGTHRQLSASGDPTATVTSSNFKDPSSSSAQQLHRNTSNELIKPPTRGNAGVGSAELPAGRSTG